MDQCQQRSGLQLEPTTHSLSDLDLSRLQWTDLLLKPKSHQEVDSVAHRVFCEPTSSVRPSLAHPASGKPVQSTQETSVLLPLSLSHTHRMEGGLELRAGLEQHNVYSNAVLRSKKLQQSWGTKAWAKPAGCSWYCKFKAERQVLSSGGSSAVTFLLAHGQQEWGAYWQGCPSTLRAAP